MLLLGAFVAAAAYGSGAFVAWLGMEPTTAAMP